MSPSPADLSTLSRLLDEVLDLEPAQAEAWLAALPEAHRHLLPQLREMLAEHLSPGRAGFMSDGPKLAGGPVDETVARPGELVGPYRLIREVGRGGMGAVWLAERADGSLKRQVALKLPRLAWGAGLAERMARERDIGALLEHPNIARLYDAGVDAAGRPYLALEYIDGQPLDAWCEAKALGVPERLRLFLQVARAVAYAHGRLVVHRDLKPSNVLVTADGQAHLLDFGIAKLLHEAVPGDPGLTQEQGRVLTPHYASPEQIRGEAITVASDVYSLGVLLYELLTGRLPFQAPSPAALEAAVLEGEPPLASSRAQDKATGRALRGEIDAILGKALKRTPAQRYASVDALAQDIERYLKGDTVLARPDTWTYRANRFVGRHKAGVALASVVLVAIVGMAVAADQQRREAERERDLATRQRMVADAVAAFLEEQLGQIAEPGASVDPTVRIDQGKRRAAQLFNDTPEVAARLHGIYYVLDSYLSRGTQKLEAIAAIAAAAERIEDPMARAQASCAATLEGVKAAQAIERIDRALASLPDGEGSRTARADCLWLRAEHWHEMGRFDRALADFDAGYALYPPLMQRINEIDYLRAKSFQLNETGAPHAADQGFARVIELLDGAGRGQSLAVATALRNRALFHTRMGRPRESLAFAERAEALFRQLGTSATYASLRRADALADLGRTDEARKVFDAVLMRDGRLQPIFDRGWEMVSYAYRVRGDFKNAVDVLERDLAANGSDGYAMWDALSRTAMARALVDAGDAGRALQVLDLLDRDPAAEPFRWDNAWHRARAENLAGRPDRAESASRAAIVLAQRRIAPGMRSAVVGRSELELAQALSAQGRVEESRAAAQRAEAELADSLGSQHSATLAARALGRL